jgi:hypothetical protein
MIGLVKTAMATQTTQKIVKDQMDVLIFSSKEQKLTVINDVRGISLHCVRKADFEKALSQYGLKVETQRGRKPKTQVTRINVGNVDINIFYEPCITGKE